MDKSRFLLGTKSVHIRVPSYVELLLEIFIGFLTSSVTCKPLAGYKIGGLICSTADEMAKLVIFNSWINRAFCIGLSLNYRTFQLIFTYLGGIAIFKD